MIDNTEALAKLGIGLPEILLPKTADLQKWPVVACDQFTSEPEYWNEVGEIVGEAPSTLKLIFPECYIGDGTDEERIARIHRTMEEYLSSGIFEKAPKAAHIVVRRLPDKPSRTGLMLNIDLESYDYSRDSTTPIRPTEGTIVERIPARKRVRSGAPVEVPHVMVLLDDPGRTIIEPLARLALGTTPVYSLPLMKNGGAVEAYRIEAPDALSRMVEAFEHLADTEVFKKRYNSEHPFFIAIGDGNHSLAAAKAYWEDLKSTLPPKQLVNHPARYAMVEAVNLYDEGITFEPIHRLFYGVEPRQLLDYFIQNGRGRFVPAQEQAARAEKPGAAEIGFVSSGGAAGIVRFDTGGASETTAAAQEVIDAFLSSHTCRIDFVHDLDRVLELGRTAGNACCIMPHIRKDEFFGFIVDNGCFPRKSFSMGESHEKRYYMEARKLKP